MGTQTNCAVCDTPLSGSSCPRCGFAYSAVSAFGSDKSRQLWLSTVAEKKELLQKEQREAQLSRLRGLRFELFHSCVCVFDSDGMTLFSGALPPERLQGVTECSVSTRHSVFVKNDGTLASRGSNEYGQCDVSDLGDVVSVYAASTCTYAVRSDGTVSICGDSRHYDTISKWRDIKRITGSKGRIVGLTKDGRLEFADDLRQIETDVTDAVDVATTHNFTLWLRRDGTVGCFANPNDARGQLTDWHDIVALGAENYYALGLRRDGAIVYASAATNAPDMGRSRVADWRNVVALSASPSCILGIFEDGGVEIVGNAEKREALRDSLAGWISEIL